MRHAWAASLWREMERRGSSELPRYAKPVHKLCAFGIMLSANGPSRPVENRREDRRKERLPGCISAILVYAF